MQYKKKSSPFSLYFIPHIFLLRRLASPGKLVHTYIRLFVRSIPPTITFSHFPLPSVLLFHFIGKNSVNFPFLSYNFHQGYSFQRNSPVSCSPENWAFGHISQVMRFAEYFLIKLNNLLKEIKLYNFFY